jgi:ribosomal 50S subunit-associated protein YjgA (DUF615 family)
VRSNTPPIDDAPLELSDQEVAQLLERLHQITDSLERHYSTQLHRLEQARRAQLRDSDSAFEGSESDPRF